MRAASGLALALVTLLPAAANAACAPSFGSGSTTVPLAPAGSLDEQQITERFQVEVRNDGDEICKLRLVVGRDIGASDDSFPTYTLSGPSGAVAAAMLTDVADPAGGRTAITITVPAKSQIRVPYDVRLSLGWGAKAGTYVQELIYQLYSSESQAEIATQRTRLSLAIPAIARVRFSGASGIDGPARVEMGPLSSTGRTVSPPFAIRVLSTSAYRIELASRNQGFLRRVNGPDLIPYRLLLGGRDMKLARSAVLLGASGHTGATGDVHPVSVVIDPDPTRHAGDYSDNVTVSITTL